MHSGTTAPRVPGRRRRLPKQAVMCGSRWVAQAVGALPVRRDGSAQKPIGTRSGEAVRLVREARTSGERRFYPWNLLFDAIHKQLAVMIEACWIRERAHQRMSGRAWPRPHRGRLVDRAASTRADDGRRLHPVPAPRRGGSEKVSAVHRPGCRSATRKALCRNPARSRSQTPTVPSRPSARRSRPTGPT